MTITEIDIVVLFVVLISSLLSLLRGFLKEFLSFAAWIGAAIITFLILPVIMTRLGTSIKESKVMAVVIVIGIYLVVLIGISIINAILLDFLRNVRSGGIDRILGLGFGFARGALIVSIAHYAVTLTHGGQGDPDWLKKSFTYPFTESGAKLVDKIVDLYADDAKALLKINEVQIEAQSLIDRLSKHDIGKRLLKGDNAKNFKKALESLTKDEIKIITTDQESTEAEFSEAVKDILKKYRKAVKEEKIPASKALEEEQLIAIEERLKRLMKPEPNGKIDLPKEENPK